MLHYPLRSTDTHRAILRSAAPAGGARGPTVLDIRDASLAARLAASVKLARLAQQTKEDR